MKAVAETVKTIGGFGRLKELLEVIREVGGLKKFKDLLEAMAATEADRSPEIPDIPRTHPKPWP